MNKQELKMFIVEQECIDILLRAFIEIEKRVNSLDSYSSEQVYIALDMGTCLQYIPAIEKMRKEGIEVTFENLKALVQHNKQN